MVMIVPTAILSTVDGTLWMGRDGNIAKYQNYFDQFKTDISANSLDVSGYTVDVSSYDTDISAISLDVTFYYGNSTDCTTAGYTWDPVAGTCTATYAGRVPVLY